MNVFGRALILSTPEQAFNMLTSNARSLEPAANFFFYRLDRAIRQVLFGHSALVHRIDRSIAKGWYTMKISEDSDINQDQVAQGDIFCRNLVGSRIF